MTRWVTVIVGAALMALPASATAAPRPMWNPFVAGSSWGMTSNVNGHVTTFGVRRLARWGCWTGDIVDLWDRKPAPEDYWQPGVPQNGHQILRRDRTGAWRMIGAWTEAPDPAHVWTLQYHSYPGRPAAYVITPGVRRDSDTRTHFYALYRPWRTDSCIPGGEAAAPLWGREQHWRSRFTFTARGDLRARYEEQSACRPACQIEEWTFRRDQAGIARIADLRSGGRSLGLVLLRHVSSRPVGE